MKQKSIVILALVAIVLVIAGVVASQQRGGEKKLADGGLLAPDLRATMDKVADIRIVSRTGDAVTQVSLQKKSDRWLVADRNYNVDTQKLATLIEALAQAKRIEAKTSKPANYGKLGVNDPSNRSDGSGKLLRFLSADGKPQLELVVGASAKERHGQYVRVASDAQAWLIDQPLQLPADATEWLDHRIVDIPAQDIVAVDFGVLILKRTADGKELELNAIPAGRELTYPGVTTAAATALSQLQMHDVVAASTITLDKPAATAVFSRASSAITVRAFHQNDKNYLTLSATAADNADDATRKQVDAWNAAWQLWAFEVETFTYNKFVKSVNDFTKEIAKEVKAP